MTLRHPRSLAVALVAAHCVVAAVGAAPASATPPRGASDRPTHAAAERPFLRHWRESKAARAALREARWSGSLGAILQASIRCDRADSAYQASLASLEPADLAATPAFERPELAADWIERGSYSLADRILRMPALGRRPSIALEALARGRLIGPAAGLETLGWPPDRRPSAPSEPPGVGGGLAPVVDPRLWDCVGRPLAGEDDAELYLAAALSDSIRDARGRRAALWRLGSDTRSPATRSYARRALARALVSRGELLLARSLLERAEVPSTEEALLLANLLAARSDTLGAVRVLAAQAGRPGLPASERYACATRGAALVKGPRIEAVPERDWMVLLRTLGELGEASAALDLWGGRRGAAPDSIAALARSELHAYLLFKARRFDASAKEYRALLARTSLDAATRAGYALGLARAERGARSFAAMDTAFVLATALDARGGTGETAAWERAREWEDSRTPRETADLFKWASPWLRAPSLRSSARVHAALAYERAGALDSARAALAVTDANDASTLFWRGLFARAAGDSAESRRALESSAARDPFSYEGLRAAEELGSGLPSTPAGPSVRRTTEPALRTQILGLVGFEDLRRERLRDCALAGPGPDANGCIDELEELGQYRIGRVASEWEFRFRYPPAFPEPVIHGADAESLSASLLWAIMRMESAYEPTARSRAGALGLLQLLPSTASRLARRPVPADSLADPGLNVMLGARYVRSLVREFGDPRAAIAAFNAGEDVVRKWIATRRTIDDRWVELIPYRETRDYVKQVYSAWRRYQSIYGSAD